MINFCHHYSAKTYEISIEETQCSTLTLPFPVIHTYVRQNTQNNSIARWTIKVTHPFFTTHKQNHMNKNAAPH